MKTQESLTIRGIISDLDGVAYRGDTAIPSSVRAFRAWHEQGVPYAFVTNNSTKSAAQFEAIEQALEHLGTTRRECHFRECRPALMMTPSLIDRMRAELGAALPLWDLSSQSTVSFLSHSENTTFLAQDPASGRRLVLRVQRIGYHTPAEIRSELAWIDALIAEEIVVTPRPVADGEGRSLCPIVLNGSPRQIAAFEYLSGKEPDPSDDLVAWFGKLDAISARLHAHSRRWKRPPDFQRKVWDFDAMLGTRPLWGDWHAGLGLREDGRKLLQRVADTFKQRLDTYGNTDDRFGLVHADLRLANLLVDGARLGVIDFDDCGFSWFFYDFAAAVSFMEHEPVAAELQASWLDGYRAIAPVSREDELMLPIFVMLQRMLLTAWIASHSDTETARPLGTDYTDGTVAMRERFLQAL